MADPKRNAPHHPPHPGSYAGKIPDGRDGRPKNRRRPILAILAVLVVVLAVVWLLIGGGEQLGEQTLGEPAGFGESATAVDRTAEMPEEPHGAIGEASEASTVLAPDVIDQETAVTEEEEEAQ